MNKKCTMGDLHGELYQNKGEGAQPLDNGALSTQAWSNGLNETARQGLSADVALEDSALFPLFSEPSLGLILKMSTSLVQPVCFGGGPVVLPLHLQVTGGADPQVAQTIGTTVIAPNPGSLCLPLILDQLLLQSSCLIPEEQHLPGTENHGPSQNPSVPLSQPRHAEEKPEILPQPSDSPPLHRSKFATLLQEPIPFFRNCASSACQGTRSLSSNPFSAAFLPQDSTPPYLCTGSPLVSLVPPASLLVPYPLVVPLPVPLPIPVPIPIPVPLPDSKAFSGSFSTSYGTKKNKSTQTSVENFGIATRSQNRKPDCHFLQLRTLPPASQQEVLDLRTKVQTKQEVQVSLPQDSALDLSVANSSHFRSCSSNKLNYPGSNSINEPKELVTRPLKYSQRHDRGHLNLNGRSKTEFGVRYKWTMEERLDKIRSKPPGRSGSFMRPLQTPAACCENLARQPQEHTLKNKLKRVTSQNINICPIKKQQLATFLPGN